MSEPITGEYPSLEALMRREEMDRSFEDLAEALARLSDLPPPSSPPTLHPFESRPMPQTLLFDRDSSLPTRPKLRVSECGEWFELPGGLRVDCTHHEVVPNVLAILAHERAIRPGETVPMEELVTATWTGELLPSEVALERLSSALETLRELGLSEMIVEKHDGFLLDASVDFALGLTTRKN
jgi:hypothetical protein